MDPIQLLMVMCRLGEVTAYWVAVGLFAVFVIRDSRRGRNGR